MLLDVHGVRTGEGSQSAGRGRLAYGTHAGRAVNIRSASIGADPGAGFRAAASAAVVSGERADGLSDADRLM
jgi:hypothetical protein